MSINLKAYTVGDLQMVFTYSMLISKVILAL